MKSEEEIRWMLEESQCTIERDVLKEVLEIEE
jgi:hypothetical protein